MRLSVLANIMPLSVWVPFHVRGNVPILTANFVEIGPEYDLANFLSICSTKPYSVNLAEPQQTERRSPPAKQIKIRVSYICHERKE